VCSTAQAGAPQAGGRLFCVECGHFNSPEELCRLAAFDLFLGELIDAKERAMRLRGQAERLVELVEEEAKARKVLESRAPAGFWAWHTSEVA
jgi:hypothetical protein